MNTKKLYLFIILCLTTLSFAQVKDETSSAITKIIVLRHAEKANDGTKNPPLSAEGIARAERLSHVFADITINALYASPYLRTQQTLQFLAQKQGLVVTNYDPSDVTFATHLIQKNKGKTIVVAGHSNSAPNLVNALIKTDKYKQLEETEFGKIWMLTFKNDQLIDCVLLNY